MLLFAITCQTVAEIIKSSSDKTKVNMRICTSWKILQADVIISKNYFGYFFKVEKNISYKKENVLGGK